MVGDPHGNFGDVRGGFVYFDAIELADLDAAQRGDIEQAAPAGVGEADVAHRFDGVHLQLTQFAEADHKEVATAAGGIEKGERGEFVVKIGQKFFVLFDLGEFGTQVVHAQRVDDAQDVALTGVVRAELAA